MKMCHMLIQSLFKDKNFAPQMETKPVKKHLHRPRTKDACFCPSPFMMSEYERIKSFSKQKPVDRKLPKRAELAYLGARPNQDGPTRKQKRKDRYIRKLRRKTRLWVTKALNKKEIDASPECQAAIRAEGEALVNCGTWDEDSVIERSELIKVAKDYNQQIVLGDLLIIGSIKFYERAREYWKYKGRICYRGDCAIDQNGAYAVYQELSASPTGIHSAKSNLCYGCLPGHKTTQVDAIRAYVQTKLKSKHPTWIRIPHLLRPKKWGRKYTAPMCRLVMALYGHPESGAHWEKHLTESIITCGGYALEEHPSSFCFPNEELMLSVYGDDLNMSGPAAEHEKVWAKLSDPNIGRIKIDEPEDLDRFLGRKHVVLPGEAIG